MYMLPWGSYLITIPSFICRLKENHISTAAKRISISSTFVKFNLFSPGIYGNTSPFSQKRGYENSIFPCGYFVSLL